eukprot:284817466_4
MMEDTGEMSREPSRSANPVECLDTEQAADSRICTSCLCALALSSWSSSIAISARRPGSNVEESTSSLYSSNAFCCGRYFTCLRQPWSPYGRTGRRGYCMRNKDGEASSEAWIRLMTSMVSTIGSSASSEAAASNCEHMSSSSMSVLHQVHYYCTRYSVPGPVCIYMYQSIFMLTDCYPKRLIGYIHVVAETRSPQHKAIVAGCRHPPGYQLGRSTHTNTVFHLYCLSGATSCGAVVTAYYSHPCWFCSPLTAWKWDRRCCRAENIEHLVSMGFQFSHEHIAATKLVKDIPCNAYAAPTHRACSRHKNRLVTKCCD